MKLGRRAALAGLALALVLVGCSKERALPGGSGFIEATEATISAEVAGQLKVVRFDEGTVIARGDTLAGIDTVSTALRLDQARAGKKATEKRIMIARISIEQTTRNADLASKEYDRAKSLVASGSVDQQRLDEVENAYRQAALARKQADAALESAEADLAKAEADVRLLEKQLSDCFPRSPTSGVVAAKYVEAGEWVGVGKALLKISVLDTVWVKVYVPAGDLTVVKIGGHASVDPEDGRSRPLDGTVTWISPEAEFTPKNVQTKEARADLVYAVKVTIPNPGGVLKVGMPVAVKIQ
ncbi:MAG TPA: HlyD family efflux transporter periplasmic adaptor subunit [bacterium]|nr:HlyD family efflux transporter periplasmic adaptor subunit [bacterium]